MMGYILIFSQLKTLTSPLKNLWCAWLVSYLLGIIVLPDSSTQDAHLSSHMLCLVFQVWGWICSLLLLPWSPMDSNLTVFLFLWHLVFVFHLGWPSTLRIFKVIKFFPSIFVFFWSTIYFGVKYELKSQCSYCHPSHTNSYNSLIALTSFTE